MTDHPSNETLQAYLDGELSMREGDIIDDHLEVCARCTGDLAQLRTVFSAIGSIEDEELTTDLAPAIVETIRPRMPRLAVGELAVLGALAFGMVLWLGGGELQRRIEGSAAQLADQFESSWLQIERTYSNLLGQLPSLPTVDLSELAESAGSILISPSILWVVVGAALALWLLGNGLILRLGKDRNA